MAPGLVTAEKAARGKLPTDVWWHTIVPTNGAEKTGYPTQKPEGIVRRMVLASTRRGRQLPRLLRRQRHARRGGGRRPNRRYTLIDSSDEAIRVCTDRLAATKSNESSRLAS